jgi:hypothetical protein
MGSLSMFAELFADPAGDNQGAGYGRSVSQPANDRPKATRADFRGQDSHLLEACDRLCGFALDTVKEKFETADPETAFLRIPVTEFVKKAEAAKRTFTNSRKAQELIRAYVLEMGSDPRDYYFDVPRLRIVPNYEYLHAGVSYAYAAHRDTWYGGPPYQINHWMPVLPIVAEQTMAIYPGYFAKPVRNTSKDFSLTHWVTKERPKAAQNIEKEDRVHPLPLEDLDPLSELRIAGGKGDLLVFSGTNLHATIPNRTAVTRFSVDFRLFHVDDMAGKGVTPPANQDSSAQSEDYGMSLCFKVDDFSRFEGTK